MSERVIDIKLKELKKADIVMYWRSLKSVHMYIDLKEKQNKNILNNLVLDNLVIIKYLDGTYKAYYLFEKEMINMRDIDRCLKQAPNSMYSTQLYNILKEFVIEKNLERLSR